MTTTDAQDRAEIAVLDDIRGTRDALSVRRVFGDPYTADGVTIIPVARIAGGGRRVGLITWRRSSRESSRHTSTPRTLFPWASSGGE